MKRPIHNGFRASLIRFAKLFRQTLTFKLHFCFQKVKFRTFILLWNFLISELLF